MALRNILKVGDPSLNKKSRPVTEFNDRLHMLLDDMQDTLIDSGGVGLAAPQVGILRRVVLVVETDHPEDEEDKIIELINPHIIAKGGEQVGPEGCLSVPGEYGIVKRPFMVKVRAQDRFGNEFEVLGTKLTARAFCHEIDHLDGHLYTEFVERMLTPEELEAMYEDDYEEDEE